MLVLTRKPGEQIVIGNNIRLTVVSVGPGRVKLGIEAPDNVRIDRQEIFEKIQRESDVLSSLTHGLPDDVSPTMVGSGDTSLSLHNRIAETLPEVQVAAGVRLPRKPR
jgi:carbon storage regulator